jgi:hypothetical protein
MDSHDTRVRWHAIDRKRFALSKDGGQSWEALVPKLDREGVIDHIELISAPNTNLSRLYAAIRINSYKEEYSLFKSEDYGHHFVYLSNEVRYATESRSDANLMIGYTNVDKEVNCWIIQNDLSNAA